MIIMILYNEEVLVDKSSATITLPSIESIQTFVNQLQIIANNEKEFIAYIDNLSDKTFIENNSTLIFNSLRSVLSTLSQIEINTAIYYKSLIHYYRQKFCNYCGSVIQKQKQNKFLHCKNCNIEIYPHIAPSIIVRITRGNEILLAKNINFATNIWSVLAGYVEIGETLEETVHREVFEEVGIKIKNLKYFGSQPWPFSGISLMLGFTAEYDSGDIKLQEDEIEAAGFFTKDNLPGLPSSKISIAHKMIDEFINSADSV